MRAEGLLGPESEAFLADLAANNRRDWFEENRARYRAALEAPGRAFAEALAERVSALAGAPVAAKVYRIHRDVRFSRDKSPYAAHLHIGLADAAGGAAWMFGLEPGKAVAGYGAFAFEGARLDRWRAAVAGPAGAALGAVLQAAGETGARIEPPELKRVPAPWPQDHPAGELLRRKGLAVWRDLAPAEAFGAEGPDRIAARLSGFAPVRNWFAGHMD